MKKLIAVFGMAAGLSVSAMAAEYTGYIIDESCASKKAMWGNEKCAQGCIGKGQQAVLVNEEGKVYKIADQDKVKEHAGHKVTISGTMNGDTIKVDSVKM